MKRGHRNTLSKILKHFLPMNIVLEEKWGFLEIFLAELYFVACCKREKRWKPEF